MRMSTGLPAAAPGHSERIREILDDLVRQRQSLRRDREHDRRCWRRTAAASSTGRVVSRRRCSTSTAAPRAPARARHPAKPLDSTRGVGRTICAVSRLRVLDLSRVLAGPVLHDAARRPGRRRGQGRAARGGRRDADVGAALRGRRVGVLPLGQPRQAQRRARPRASRGAGGRRPARARGGRRGRELPAGSRRAARRRLRAARAREPGARLLLDHGLRGRRGPATTSSSRPRAG